MRQTNFIALYRCKSAYNQKDILLDNLASIRQERLEKMAKVICFRVAKHRNFEQLTGQDIITFDNYMRPLIMASKLQRLRLMYETTHTGVGEPE